MNSAAPAEYVSAPSASRAAAMRNVRVFMGFPPGDWAWRQHSAVVACRPELHYAFRNRTRHDEGGDDEGMAMRAGRVVLPQPAGGRGADLSVQDHLDHRAGAAGRRY